MLYTKIFFRILSANLARKTEAGTWGQKCQKRQESRVDSWDETIKFWKIDRFHPDLLTHILTKMRSPDPKQLRIRLQYVKFC
ncbi:MAG TPA: hypothetical protein DCQ63_10555 [Planktothrix sp. UBA8402]|nr:hypothetical protein [Planktothrix sp. UBA8402]